MAPSAALSPALPESHDAVPTAPPLPAAGFSHITAAFHAASAAALERGSAAQLVLDPTLRAVTAFLTVFDALGSPVVTQLVSTDFRWKTDAVRAAMLRLGVDEAADLVRRERESPPGFFDASGIDALLWASRVLAFVDALVCRLLQDGATELRDAALDAYRETIGLRHNAVAKAVFENALLLLPAREKFIENFFGMQDPTEVQLGEIYHSMREFRVAVRPHIEAFADVFEDE